MDKITIVSIFNRHEDFIELQYNSILKHVKGEYEYIIFNNASDEAQSNRIKDICNKLDIECIRIYVNYNAKPSNIAGEALNESFKYLTDKIVFKIDSDMFFISDINLHKICNENDLFYIETHHKYMWSAVFSLNMKKIKDINLNFNPRVIPNTDTFGQSCLLTARPEYSRKKMLLYCIMDENHGVIDGSINGDCRVTLTNSEIIFKENNRYDDLCNITLNDKFFKTYEKIIDYKFPKPYFIDVITLDDTDIIIHFKSSNHDNIYSSLDYTNSKKISLLNFLTDN